MIRLRTPFSGTLLCVVVARGALPQGEAQEPRRWQRPEVGVNVALGLGRGQFQQCVDAAVGFGGYGSLPVALHGGLALRADLSGEGQRLGDDCHVRPHAGVCLG